MKDWNWLNIASFFHENESMKAAKHKGNWAHEQTDKTTPWTIVSLSVVEDVGESDSNLWKDRRVNNKYLWVVWVKQW